MTKRKLSKLSTIITLLIFVVIAVSVSIIYSHMDKKILFELSESYCPNCYEPTAIRVDVQRVCEKCGHKFYLLHSELPDSIK